MPNEIGPAGTLPCPQCGVMTPAYNVGCDECDPHIFCRACDLEDPSTESESHPMSTTITAISPTLTPTLSEGVNQMVHVDEDVEEPLTERNASTEEEFLQLSFHDLVHADVYHGSTMALAEWLRTVKLHEFRHQIATTIADIESQQATHRAGIGALGQRDEKWVRAASAVKARYQARMVEVKELVRKRNIAEQEERHESEALVEAIRRHMTTTLAEFAAEGGTVMDEELWDHLAKVDQQ